jgi:site-specific DNA-methyltransferase (adenine-specific)
MQIETIGDATLYLGECSEVIPTLSNIACVVTSPPYNQLENVGKNPTGSWKEKNGSPGFAGNWAANGYADDLPEGEYQSQQNELFRELASVCNPDASLFYNHQLRWRDGVCLHPINWFSPDNWKLRTEIIWDRRGGMMMNARMFCRFDERVIWFVRGKVWKWNQSQVGFGTVWSIPSVRIKDHPVAFPVEMPTRCIAATTDPKDIVLDPYSGSASTGIAAISLGRKFIGIEREPKYFDIACKRIEDAQRQGDMFIHPAKAKPEKPVGLFDV